MAKRGRPSTYKDETALEICTRVASGRSLRSICEADDMPPLSVVYQWLHARAEFAERYARACEERAESYADEIADIADSEPDPQRARVRIDARKWVAAKLKPQRFGDRVDHRVQHSGGVSFTIDMGNDEKGRE